MLHTLVGLDPTALRSNHGTPVRPGPQASAVELQTQKQGVPALAKDEGGDNE